MTAATIAHPRRRRTVPAPSPRRAGGPALRVVSKPRDRAAVTARRRRSLVVGTCTLAALSLFGVAAAHVVIAQSQFQLARLERESTEQQAQYDRLRLQVAELESPARIVAAAQERLGMVPPAHVTYLTPPPLDRAAKPPRSAGGHATTAAAGPSEWSLLKPHLSSR